MELQISNLSKTYPNGVHALRNVTLTIPRAGSTVLPASSFPKREEMNRV